MEFLNNSQVEAAFQLLLSAFLGALIGLERETQKKQAGLRTYTLVSLGSTLFTIVSLYSFQLFAVAAGMSFDPSRIVGQIVVGIGFLGAGLIIFRDSHVEGLTTAAGLWLVAAIGCAVAFQFYFIAFFTGMLALLVLAGLKLVEKKFFHKEE